MATAYFSSTATFDVVEAQFLDASNRFVPLKLLVDSGFTESSSLALSASAHQLSQAPVPAVQVLGALTGIQPRVVVTCRISALAFERSFLAILTHGGSLNLPDGIDGIVGLRFLRCFRRWGSEESAKGDWRFFFETRS